MTEESPCIKVCTVKDNVCIGCGRTRDEIARWTRLTLQERKSINERLSRNIQ